MFAPFTTGEVLYILRFHILGLAVILIAIALLWWMYKHGRMSKQLLAIFLTIALILTAGIGGSFAMRWYDLKHPKGPDLGQNNCKPGYPCAIIEDEGKKKVAELPEVQALAQKYGWPHVHIQALDISDVKDKKFLAKVYPGFADDAGCIILVHANDTEGYVYKENEKDLSVIYAMTLKEFLERTKGVDAMTMARFYLALH